MNDILEALRKPFAPDEVKQRPMKRGSKTMLDYVSIDATINRLLDVLGFDWSFTVDSTTVTPVGEDGDFLAVVTGTLRVEIDAEKHQWTEHGGVGADVASDPDKAVKTALAEALKKAGHQLGVGLYLWDADERAKLDTQRLALDGDLASLKRLVTKAAEEGGANIQSAEAIAEFHGVDKKDLSDPNVLRGLIFG